MAAASVAAITVGIWALGSGSGTQARKATATWGGPLANGGSLGYGQPVDVGHEYSYGDLDIRNGGSRSAVLDRVWLAKRSADLGLLGAYIQDNPPKHAIGFGRGFRRAWGEPIEGHVLTAGDGGQIVVGLAVSKPGRHSFDGLGIAYHVGDKNYEWRVPVAVQLCAPAAKYFGKCSPPEPTSSRTR